MGLETVTFESLLSEKLHPCEIDSVAYIEKGREYGLISIDKVESLDYDFYVEYAQNWRKFDSMIDDYKNDVIAFNEALGGRTILAEPDYSKFKAWEAELIEKERILDQLEKKLGSCFSETLGIVKTVDIYW
jgi:hypothetical protein